MSMRHVTTPKRFTYASVSVDSTEMGLGVLVSNKFTNFHALFRPDVRESAFRDLFSCRTRNPENFSFGIWNRHDPGGYVPLASRSPYPIIVHSVANYRRYLSHFWANV